MGNPAGKNDCAGQHESALPRPSNAINFPSDRIRTPSRSAACNFGLCPQRPPPTDQKTPIRRFYNSDLIPSAANHPVSARPQHIGLPRDHLSKHRYHGPFQSLPLSNFKSQLPATKEATK
jgi:hypothetical protein